MIVVAVQVDAQEAHALRVRWKKSKKCPECSKDVIYYRKKLSGICASYVSGPTNTSTDNKGAHDLSYNPEFHARSKHIKRRHFYVRDMVEAHELVVPLIKTDDNPADFFTKPLAPKQFKYLRRRIMNLVA